MSEKSNTSKVGLISVLIPLLIASTLFDVILELSIGYVPSYLAIIKIAILAYFMSTNFVMSKQGYSKFILILIVIILATITMDNLSNSDLLNAILDPSTATGAIGGPILSKMIGAFIVLIVLVFSYNTPKRAFIAKGNIDEKFDFFNLNISWKNITPIIIILFLAIYIFVFVTINEVDSLNFSKLLPNLLVIISLSLMNALGEGIIYRSSLIATLKESALSKNVVIILVTLFYGLASYYFIPGGFINIIVYTLFGYFMVKSVYETEGFIIAWFMNIVLSVVHLSMYYLTNII